MRAHTHATTGLALGLAGISFGIFGFLALPLGHGFLTLVLLAALLPDIDHHSSSVGRKLPGISHAVELLFGHRGILHSVWGIVFFGGATWLICRLFSVGAWKLIVFAICFGYFTHLVSDSFTKTGVKWFYPLEIGHARGPVNTGGMSELMFLLVHIVIVGFFLSRMGWGVLHFI